MKWKQSLRICEQKPKGKERKKNALTKTKTKQQKNKTPHNTKLPCSQLSIETNALDGFKEVWFKGME